ncbi:hypothetical protein [Photobacterium iliopiscarium]|uniref:DUF4393 domain-containing protein n=1 Tax=Photobacterium iliopiscarium TaxID=56192 RepID=A0A2T3MNI3_9GAMM|nr:hypothetical protein [Photobacterium iliopiscarium]PSV98312.1 hypothetical protein C9I88_06515 [Photobacterium iliopiscarium]
MTNLSRAVSNSIGAELTSVSFEIAEVSIDSVLDEGLLQDIPIIGSVVGLAKTGVAIRDRMYVQKLLKFLSEFKKISSERRDEFISSELNTDKKKDKFGETMINLIDRAENDEKLVLYAKVFEYHFMERVTYDYCIRLCQMIERAFYADLLFLLEFEDLSLESQEITSELYKNGFLSFAGVNGGNWDGEVSSEGGMLYRISSYGNNLKTILQEI